MLIQGPAFGPHDPVLATPDRARCSVRRTSTIDTRYPEGIAGPVRRVDGRARDIWTDADGKAHLVAQARLDVELDSGTRAVRSIASDPPDDALQELLGAPAAGGFRARVDRHLPHLTETGGLLYLLLDDLPGASLVAGYAMLHAGVVSHSRDDRFLQAQADLCAGWAADGFLLNHVRDHGSPPRGGGPPAPALEREDDPDAWHDTDPLPPHGMRRRRRLDVSRSGELLAVDVHFRDTHVDAEGRESIVHEYAVAATVDPATWLVVESAAEPRVLPWRECPGAAASATRVAGRPVTELRPWVRATFTGTSTCTHLNDTLRGLADVPALARILEEAS